jgi:hypothetical protein
MLEELDGPKEPAEKRATRKWKNNELRQKIIASKAAPVVVDPKAPPEVGSVLVNKAKRRPGGFERKFIKELREMLDERKREHLEMIRASLAHQRRRLMLEKLRRLELNVAASEKRIAGAQSVTKSRDLFA